MPVARLVTPGPSVAVTTAGRCRERAKPYAMNAAPCSWRVRTKRISGVARSTSRIGRFIVPGIPKTWSMPSLRRQSTSACADVATRPVLGNVNRCFVPRRPHDRLQHGHVVDFVPAGDRERPMILRRAREMLQLGPFSTYILERGRHGRFFGGQVAAIDEAGPKRPGRKMLDVAHLRPAVRAEDLHAPSLRGGDYRRERPRGAARET